MLSNKIEHNLDTHELLNVIILKDFISNRLLLYDCHIITEIKDLHIFNNSNSQNKKPFLFNYIHNAWI